MVLSSWERRSQSTKGCLSSLRASGRAAPGVPARCCALPARRAGWRAMCQAHRHLRSLLRPRGLVASPHGHPCDPGEHRAALTPDSHGCPFVSPLSVMLSPSVAPQGRRARAIAGAAQQQPATTLAETDTHVPGEQGWVGSSEALQTAWSVFGMSDSAGK